MEEHLQTQTWGTKITGSSKKRAQRAQRDAHVLVEEGQMQVQGTSKSIDKQLPLCCRHQVIERRMRDTYLSSTVSGRCTNNCDNCMHEADKMDNITSTMRGAFEEMCKKKNAGQRMNETALKECFHTLPATRYAHQKATPFATLTIAESDDKQLQEAIVCACEGRAHSCAL